MLSGVVWKDNTPYDCNPEGRFASLQCSSSVSAGVTVFRTQTHPHAPNAGTRFTATRRPRIRHTGTGSPQAQRPQRHGQTGTSAAATKHTHTRQTPTRPALGSRPRRPRIRHTGTGSPQAQRPQGHGQTGTNAAAIRLTSIRHRQVSDTELELTLETDPIVP